MNETVLRTLTASGLTIFAAVAWLFLPPLIISALLLAILLYILAYEWPKLNPWRHNVWRACLFSLAYPILPFVLIIVLNQTNIRGLLIFLCLITFSNDTGAYIAGRLYGRHAIMPQVSPRKSWEGFVGGYVLSLAVGLFLVYNTSMKLSLTTLPLSILFLNFAGLGGDLFESYLKRRAHVKDSGKVLPGHGGFLDRLDSLLFSVFAFYFIMFFI